MENQFNKLRAQNLSYFEIAQVLNKEYGYALRDINLFLSEHKKENNKN